MYLQGVEQIDLSPNSPVVQLCRAGGANLPPSTLNPPLHHPSRPKASRAPNVAGSALGAASCPSPVRTPISPSDLTPANMVHRIRHWDDAIWRSF